MTSLSTQTISVEHFAVLPSGRILGTGFHTGQPHRRAFYSDDGGE